MERRDTRQSRKEKAASEKVPPSSDGDVTNDQSTEQVASGTKALPKPTRSKVDFSEAKSSEGPYRGGMAVSRPMLEPHARPRLDNLRDTSIREFLHAEREYQHWLSSSGYHRFPLRSLLKPSLLHVVEDFMSDNGAEVPEDKDQPASADNEDLTEWDVQLRRALEAATVSRTAEREISIKEAEKLVRKNVRWDTTLETFQNAFWEFRTQWHQVLADHGLTSMFTDGGESGKRTVLLLTSLIQPEAFKGMVESEVKRDSVNKQSVFFQVVRDLSKVYVGIMLERRLNGDRKEIVSAKAVSTYVPRTGGAGSGPVV